MSREAQRKREKGPSTLSKMNPQFDAEEENIQICKSDVKDIQ
jgi:hypothetical protein